MEQKEKANGNIFDGKVLRRIFVFVKPYIGKFYFIIFLTLILAVLAPVRPVLIQQTIDNHIIAKDYNGLLQITLLLVVLTVFQAGIQFTHTYLSAWLGQHIIRDIRIKLYDHVLKLRLKFYDQTPIGRLVTRTVSDIETLSQVFTNGLAAIIADLLQLVFIVSVMLYIDWRLTRVSLSTLPFLIISTYVFKEKIKSAFSEVRAAVSNLNTFVQEHITGMNIVQIFNSEKREARKFNDINEEHLAAHLRTVKYFSIYFPVAEVIAAIGTGLVVWFGARGILQWYSGISNYEMTPGILIAFIMFLAQFFRPIRMIADRFNTLQLGIVSSDRIITLLDNQEDVVENGKLIPEKITGKVSFQNVWFAYNEEEYVLQLFPFLLM